MPGLFDQQNGGLITYWKSKAAITSIVGTGSACRIWPDEAKQGVSEPYVVFEVVGGVSEQHLAGVSGVRGSVVHVYSYAATRAGADALSEAIRTSTANYRGLMSGVFVNWVEASDAPDGGIDRTQDGSNTQRYWTRLILRIAHAEALGV